MSVQAVGVAGHPEFPQGTALGRVRVPLGISRFLILRGAPRPLIGRPSSGLARVGPIRLLPLRSRCSFPLEVLRRCPRGPGSPWP